LLRVVVEPGRVTEPLVALALADLGRLLILESKLGRLL
tara:strand:+ start:706 stop:819 length:114 start_codon:yes stop_codon:yes gene_type:complete